MCRFLAQRTKILTILDFTYYAYCQLDLLSNKIGPYSHSRNLSSDHGALKNSIVKLLSIPWKFWTKKFKEPLLKVSLKYCSHYLTIYVFITELFVEVYNEIFDKTFTEFHSDVHIKEQSWNFPTPITGRRVTGTEIATRLGGQQSITCGYGSGRVGDPPTMVFQLYLKSSTYGARRSNRAFRLRK